MGTSGTDRVTNAFRLVNKRMKNKPKCRPRVIANVISGLVYETPSVATWFPPPPPALSAPPLCFERSDSSRLSAGGDFTSGGPPEGRRQKGDVSLLFGPFVSCTYDDLKKKNNIISHLPSLLSSLLISTCPDLLLFL